MSPGEKAHIKGIKDKGTTPAISKGIVEYTLSLCCFKCKYPRVPLGSEVLGKEITWSGQCVVKIV